MRMTIGLGLALAVCLPTGASALEMTAGVAKASITNKKPLVMVNSRLSQGTLKDIYARVLVLNDGRNRLVFVTYDLNCLDVAAFGGQSQVFGTPLPAADRRPRRPGFDQFRAEDGRGRSHTASISGLSTLTLWTLF